MIPCSLAQLCKMCGVTRPSASQISTIRVALVRTDFSEELSASFFRVTRISELGTILISSQRASVASYG
jgi:hypothetical protein